MKPITDKQFAAFFAAKTPGEKCPQCGHDDWVTTFGEKSDRRLVDAFSDRETEYDKYNLPAKSHMMIVLICENCGNVRQHARYVIENWIEENNNG